ncbi:MAG TPA: CHASE3 domain-containing protein [Bryobacteraceae bacterium]|nr:CHASE3 domain-containing protein [Bryobacteraceae bacterium]
MRRPLADMPLAAKGIVVVAIPVLALFAALMVFLQFQRQSTEAAAWVEHTYQVRSELRQISLLMVSAEAAARGYLLTGDDSLLDRYRAAREEVPLHITNLRKLVGGNQTQVARINAVEQQIAATIHAFGATGDGAVPGGNVEMDRLREQLNQMESDEGRLLNERTKALHAAQRRLEDAVFAGGVFGLLGGLISALIFNTRISRRIRHVADDAGRLARGEPIGEETGSSDEIAQLSHTMKQTSELLASRNAELNATHQKLQELVRQRTEELAESNQIRQAVVGASPLAIWVVDLEGKVKFWNPAAQRIFGWTQEEVLGHPLPVIPEDQSEEFRDWMERMARGESISALERKRLRKDGTLLDMLIWTAPLLDSAGHIYGAIFIDSDVTEMKLLEQQFRQSQKLEAVGRLAGGVAHDFNNLLTVIMGYVEMLITEAGDQAELVEYAHEIQYAADRASALTAQLLAFGRRQISQPRVLDLNDVVTHSVKLLHRIIGEDIQIAVHLAPDLGKIKADPIHLDQVIMNLVVNARDAMPKGGRLTIDTATVTLDDHYADRHIGVSPGTYAMLAVSDTGIGMNVETRSRLFEPFFTTKEPGKGTGLGLAIVYGIVQQTGGEIMVYSEEGRGTTFKVYLPLVEVPAEIAAAEARLVGMRGSETVLLCEDEDHIRKLVETMLTRQGYRVLVAETPDGAIVLARNYSGRIDLLLTDIIMPQKSGFDLAREVREIRPNIKLLLMSGYTDNRVSSSWVLDASTPFLQKPFSAASLTHKVREALGAPVIANI